MIDNTHPTISLFQNDNIEEVCICNICRTYSFSDKKYALVEIDVIDKRVGKHAWFTVELNVSCENKSSVYSQYININYEKSIPTLYKLEWGDKQFIYHLIELHHQTIREE